MNVKTCQFDGCDAAVRIKQATELGSIERNGTKIVCDVKYCDHGHTLDYMPHEVNK